MITNYAISLEAVDAKSQNVKDMYKGWLTAEIRADLDTKRSDMVSIFMNLTNDFNKSTAIRANNAFLGREVYLVGKRRYDRRGTVGVHNYEHVFHADNLEEVVEKLRADGYTIFAVENSDWCESENVWGVTFPKKSAFLYGEEGLGLAPESVTLCDKNIFIENPGSVRSLNVACAASAIMSEYSRQRFIEG